MITALRWTGGDGTTGSVTSHQDPDRSHAYAEAGTYVVRLRGLVETLYFNNGGDKDKIVSVDRLGTIGLTSAPSALSWAVAIWRLFEEATYLGSQA